MSFILAMDFDGTLFEDDFPNIGPSKADIVAKVKEFKENGSEIVLWTCREGKFLDEAVEECKKVGIEFDAVNSNAPSQKKFMEEQMKLGRPLALRKIYANFYCDDKALNLDIFLKIDVKATCERFAK